MAVYGIDQSEYFKRVHVSACTKLVEAIFPENSESLEDLLSNIDKDRKRYSELLQIGQIYQNILIKRFFFMINVKNFEIQKTEM